MQRQAFSTFKEIAVLSQGKQIVLFGAGNIAAKTARRLERLTFIVDNNPNMWGVAQLGVPVRNPAALLEENEPEIFIIICTTSFPEVSEQLQKMEFVSGQDFVVSPILNDLRIISELEACRQRLLFSSGSPEEDSSCYGGGIYDLQVDGDRWEHKKLYSGICYGLIRYGETFITVDDKRGLIEFDPEFNIIRSRQFKQGTRGHGIAFSNITKCFYVAASNLDQILVFDQNFELINEISLSRKFQREGAASHHCNDLTVVGSSLYVSMFSYTGNWKRDIFDGVVLEIDIETQTFIGPIISDLWMPHNVTFYDGSLVVLDSLRGQLKKHNAQVIGQFPGFTRGIDYDGIYFYIGQSRNRNYSKYLGLSNNISIDTSIIIFDEETKVSRSLQLPSKLSEIHSILLV